MNAAERKSGGKREPGSLKLAAPNALLWSVRQSALEVGVPYSSWREHLLLPHVQEQIPMFQIGKRNYVRPADVRRYVESQRRVAS